MTSPMKQDDAWTCIICGIEVEPAVALEIEKYSEFDNKSCPRCCRTYVEARREELSVP